MASQLNITNGDCAVQVLTKAGIPGDFLPWRDVLHEGPVPAGLSLSQLSDVRADYIHRQGWGDREKVRQDFIYRDQTLASYSRYQKTILWFEHDLYDQLQLIQLLSWFAELKAVPTSLFLVCTSQYLGEASRQDVTRLELQQTPVCPAMLRLAEQAWKAFTAPTPEPWADLLTVNTQSLPFLNGAIERMLQEYPAPETGLSRTQHTILQTLKAESMPRGKLFAEYQATESRRFMGDWSFWGILKRLSQAPQPLISLLVADADLHLGENMQRLSITPAGLEVLDGQESWLDIQRIDQWLGGVHLTPTNTWYWDRENRELS